mgnify:FL=1
MSDNRTPLQKAKDALGSTTADAYVKPKPKKLKVDPPPKKKLPTLTPQPKYATAREAEIAKARAADEKAIKEMLKQKALAKAAKNADMDQDMQRGSKNYEKSKSKGYAKGGKVRGCGCAKRGLTKGRMV